MDIAISSVSPLPMGGYLLEGVAPADQGFGALLRGGDNSPPSGAKTVRAGPSGEPVQGGQGTGGDDLGAARGAALQPLPPVAPLVGVQPPAAESHDPSQVRTSDRSEEPLPAAQGLGGGGIRHHKALVVAAGVAGGFEDAGPAASSNADKGAGTVQGSDVSGGAGVQRTDAKVVAFRMTPPERGSSGGLVAKGGMEQPSVGSSGQGGDAVGSIRRGTHVQPSEPPGSGAGELPPPGTKETLEGLTQRVGTGDVQRVKARVVAAAVMDRTHFDSGTSLLGRSSDKNDRIEPTPGSGATQHQSRVLGRPVADTVFDHARTEGVGPATRNDNSRPPADLPGTEVQRHKAAVVAAGVEPPAGGEALEGASKLGERQLVGAQRGDSTEVGLGTFKPTAYGVRIVPDEATPPEVSTTGQSALRQTLADQASAGAERVHASARPAAVVTAVAAYGGSEVRASAQPFPRLDYRF